MQILGKFVLLLLIVNLSFAGVKASFSHEKAYKGDRVELIIESSEDNTEFPDLKTIGEFEVEGVSSSQNVSIINGKRSAVNTRKYSFVPTKSFVLNPLKIRADGKVFTTKKIQLNIEEPKETKDPLYSFKISTSAKDIYVGESFLVSLEFDYDERLDLSNLYFDSSNLGDVLVKELNRNWKKTNELRRVKYSNEILVTPIKEGTLELGKQQIIAEFNQRDRFSMFGRGVQKRVFSNPLLVDIKAMPDGAELIGKFAINGKVDKNKIETKEAVTITYEVFGEGNLENFELSFPKIEGVTLFEDKSSLQYRMENKNILSKKSFKGAYVSDRSFTIPPATIKYFDKDLGKVVEKKSRSFYIEVQGAKQESKPSEIILGKSEVNQTKIIEKVDPWMNFYFFIGGTLFGLGIFALFNRKSNKKKEEKDLIYGKGNKKELYNQLLSFSDDKDVKILLNKLEKEFYFGEKSGLKKKDLKKLIDEKLSSSK